LKAFDHHFTEILSGGWPVIWLKIQFVLKKLVLFLCGIWAVPAVIVIRCLRPWWIIRMGSITSSRMGCFALEVGQKWVVAQMENGKYLDLYWFNKPICNSFLAKIVQRNFHVNSLVQPIDFWNRIIPGGMLHTLPLELTMGCRDIHGWLEQTHAALSFLPEEDIQAKAWLRNQGWQEGEPFICLFVRDSSYLDKTYPNTTPTSSSEKFDPEKGYGWSHLDYRDSDITTYIKGAEWLANQGVWVLRMGKIMARPIPSSHHKIIDYAFHPEKSDFLDVWLFAHCDLCISNFAGPDVISSTYRRPLLILNYSPVQLLFSWSNAIHIPKNLVWSSTGKMVKLHDHYRCSQELHLEPLGVKLVDLSPEIILSAVQERWQRMQGKWVDTEEDISRQKKFWEILKKFPDFDACHGWRHPECKAATVWLRSMDNDFFDLTEHAEPQEK